jgi:hypothetical protein
MIVAQGITPYAYMKHFFRVSVPLNGLDIISVHALCTKHCRLNLNKMTLKYYVCSCSVYPSVEVGRKP